MERTLSITYRDDGLSERGLDTLERAMDGETVEPVIGINFTEARDLDRLLTESNVRLLTAIVERAPPSVSALADATDRDSEAVAGDLAELRSLGVIEYDETGDGMRPVLRGEATDLEISVTIG